MSKNNDPPPPTWLYVLNQHGVPLFLLALILFGIIQVTPWLAERFDVVVVSHAQETLRFNETVTQAISERARLDNEMLEALNRLAEEFRRIADALEDQ